MTAKVHVVSTPSCGRALSSLLAIVAAACGSTPAPVAPEVVAAEEQRLLRPFQDQRVIIADQVELTLSANFLGSRVQEGAIEKIGSLAGNRVALPGVDKNLHERRTTRDQRGIVETYVNKLGGVERPLRVMVGATQFQALQAVTVHVLQGGAAMTLDVTAHGDVNVLAGSQRTDVPQVEIKDGLWRGQ